MRNRTPLLLGLCIAGAMSLSACERPTAEGQTVNQASNRADTSRTPAGGPTVQGGPERPLDEKMNPDAQAGPKVRTGNGDVPAKTEQARNPAPEPGSNASSSGGAVSSNGRGSSGSSLSPTVSGTSPYANSGNGR